MATASGFPSVLWHCWLCDRKCIQPATSWVLVCWRWRYDCSFARLTAAVITTTSIILIIIIIIIRSRRQQRSVASTQSGHDDEPWTIQHECWRVYRRRSARSMNGAGVLAVAANQDQNGSRFLLLRPVIMRSALACGHRVLPHGQTMSFVSRRWHPEHRDVILSFNKTG